MKFILKSPEKNVGNHILVTGGNGYIGSHVVMALKNAGYVPVIIDQTTLSKSVITPNIGIKTFAIDLTNKKAVEKIFAQFKFTAVFHLAAAISVSESTQKPLEYFIGNTTSTANILSAMEKHNVTQLVFSSSAAVYQNTETGKPIQEDDVKNPLNPYGSSKLACEWLIHYMLTKNPTWKAVIFRYFNVAGFSLKPSNFIHDTPHIIPMAIKAALGKVAALKIYGDNYPTHDHTAVRDYVHVDDVANAHLKALEYMKKGKYNTFNLGSQTAYTVLDIVRAVEKVSGKTVRREFYARRSGDPAILLADISRAKRELEFKSTFNLEEIVRSEYKQWVPN